MQQDEFNLDEAVAMLARTPASLSALLAGLSDRWVSATAGTGSWSPYDIIGHLIHGERTDWIPRARHILAGETRPFDPFDRTAQFIGQIIRTMAKEYVGEVGPWRAYLSILQ